MAGKGGRVNPDRHEHDFLFAAAAAKPAPQTRSWWLDVSADQFGDAARRRDEEMRASADWRRPKVSNHSLT